MGYTKTHNVMSNIEPYLVTTPTTTNIW